MNERKFFPKNERLSRQKDIDRLFASGQSFVTYPLRIVYLHDNEASSPGISILVSVSKKKIRQAVKRNRIKRLIRESFRLNKSEIVTFLKRKKRKLHIALLYLGKDLTRYVKIEKAVQKALKHMEASPLPPLIAGE